MAYAQKWEEEEYCNICLTLCYQVDAMINSYLKELEQSFVTEGGIKERMYKARTGFRNSIDERLSQLEQENVLLRKENERLTNMFKEYETKYSNLKERALRAYYEQQEEINILKSQK